MKKINELLLIVFLTVISTINVNASTNTYDRSTLENYGVNKNIEKAVKYINIESKITIINMYIIFFILSPNLL